MAMRILLIIAALSYLLGSIPFGYLLVRIFRGEDVRQSGSGNIGATNVSRKSPALGVATLLLDAAKGTGAVALSYVVADHIVGDSLLGAACAGGIVRRCRPCVSGVAEIPRWQGSRHRIGRIRAHRS